ncbi:MAG TPA: D-2-hydroxyacid dehydrogenase [Burkholderiales bacterium]|nr:D-2-hydroxyacid dehydrogenase [Burkholderiales bacterium]
MLAVEPEPGVAEMIDRLSLREATQPMRDHPRWRKPARIGVQLPGWITPAVPDAMQRFRRAAGEVEVVEITGPSDPHVAQLDAIVTFCTPAMLKAANNLRWLHSFVVGVEQCALFPDIGQYNFVLTNAQRTSGPTIAEHVIGLMMALTRSLQYHHRNQLDANWVRSIPEDVAMFDVEGKTMLVVGLGGIGVEVAQRAAGLGMRVIATRRSGRDAPDFVEHIGTPDELFELAARADVVVNALPLTEETRYLFDRRFFDTVKRGAYFINVGRGASVVTADLVAALKDGRLRGAGLDVHDPSPLPGDHELWRLPNVIITPHISSQTVQSQERMAAVAIENVRRYVRGDRLLSVVDLKAGY